MEKLKRKLAFIHIWIMLLSLYIITEPNYDKCSYTILDNDPCFAQCSCGKVYIGDAEFLESIPQDKGVILVEDQRESNNDPNMEIYNSCEIRSRCERNEVLEILQEYERQNPTDWDRSIESMRLEWLMHNLSYAFKWQEQRSAHVDLNNRDESCYKSKVLQFLFRV